MRISKVHPICIYGAFGSGKTVLIGELVRDLIKHLGGGRARLVTCEHYNSIQEVIDDGLIEVWKVNTRAHPFETMRFAADGYWPNEVVKGIATSNAPLVAPDDSTFQDYPIRIFEGIATSANYIASNHAEGGLLDRAGRGDIIGPVQEHIQFLDGNTGIGGMCWAHYNIAQREMVGLVQRTQKQPGYVIWTSHEDDGKERRSPIIGPEVIGSALTGTIGREFADLWRIGGVPVDYLTNAETGEKRRIIERRLYIKEHFDHNGAGPYKAKNSAGRARQAEMPEYFRLTDPEKPGVPRDGVGQILVEKLGL